MLPNSVKEQINQNIWRQYPELSGVTPTISRGGAAASLAGTGGLKLQNPAFTLTYQTKVAIPGGRKLNRWVRVALNADGQILKISTSK